MVVLHGYARLTVDVDRVVDLDEEQARKAIKALVGMGLRPRVPVDARDFADRSVREGWIRDRGMQVFSMFDPADPMRVVDLFVHHPIAFKELWARSNEFELQDTIVHVASIPDLIHLKRLAGRPQDQSDIGQLEAILDWRRYSRSRIVRARLDRNRLGGRPDPSRHPATLTGTSG